MADNIPETDTEKRKGPPGWLADLEIRLAKQVHRICWLEVKRRLDEERIARLETVSADYTVGIAARQDEQPFNCLDDCATQRHKWDTMRRQMKQSCEENNKLFDALLLANTRANEAEEKLAVVKDLLRNVERDKAELLKDDDQLTGTLSSMIARANEVKKEISFLIEENARLHRKCNHMQEVAEQASARANNAEVKLSSSYARNTELCEENVRLREDNVRRNERIVHLDRAFAKLCKEPTAPRNVALTEENERLRRDYTKLYKIVLLFKAACDLSNPYHSEPGGVRFIANRLDTPNRQFLHTIADAIEAALEATKEAGL